MHRQWMHWLAWTLGAFMLVILGTVVGQATRSEFTTQPSAEVIATSTATFNAESNTEAALREREQMYRSLIEEANARLEEAYRQIEALSAQIAASSSNSNASALTASPETSADISPARAIWIAMNVAPGSALVKEPELVLFQGALAYEVVLDQGILYIDANTGRILYNGIPPVIQIEQPQPSDGQGSVQGGNSRPGERHSGNEDRDDDHEDDEDEEHEDDD